MCPTGTSPRPTSAAGSDPALRPAFEILDSDRDGKISHDDLRVFYKGFSINDTDDDVIGTMITVADSNKDGFVEYEEFESVLGCGDIGTRRCGGVMEEVFKVIDKDGDGNLSHDDLKSYMEWAGFEATDEDIKAMIKLGGGDEKKGVSYDGLLKILAVDCV